VGRKAKQRKERIGFVPSIEFDCVGVDDDDEDDVVIGIAVASELQHLFVYDETGRGFSRRWFGVWSGSASNVVPS